MNIKMESIWGRNVSKRRRKVSRDLIKVFKSSILIREIIGNFLGVREKIINIRVFLGV